MKGYTIQHSIELLEKEAGSGSGGASTAAEVSFDNTGTGLVATNVQNAISEVNAKVNNYSATEHLIGKYGNDDLYEATIHIESLPNNTSGVYPHGLTVDKIKNIFGTITFASGNVGTIPHVSKDEVKACIDVYASDTNIYIDTGTDRTTCSADVTLQYTKPTPVTNTRSKKSSK